MKGIGVHPIVEMGERKVVNKYYPPDFNPASIPRRRPAKNHRTNDRSMLSMSLRCSTCGSFIYKGTKINARKQDVAQSYLGIKVVRFYFKCTNCCAEIIFKTDPRNSDYTLEYGATRNFEPWRAEDHDDDEELEKSRRDGDGDGLNAMKSLEKKRSLAALEELKSIKSRQASTSVDDVLETWKQRNMDDDKAKKMLEEEEDEAKDRSLFRQMREMMMAAKRRIRDERLEQDDEEEEEEDTPSFNAKRLRPTNDSVTNAEKTGGGSREKAFINKKPEYTLCIKKKQQRLHENPTSSSALKSLCCQYDDEDEEED